MKLLLVLLMCFFLINCTKSKKSSSSTQAPEVADNVDNVKTLSCPENYVEVSALEGYTTNSFCVMKYEAKNDGSNNAVSQASGAPYVNISRTDAIDKCTEIGEGYDLITNDEWQTLARNIELVSDNWGGEGTVGSSAGLSRGHSDTSPSRFLDASSDDTNGCFETGQTCSDTMWHHQRRTHTLSNGEVIWDIAGNAWEWVKDNNEFKYGGNTYISQVTSVSHPTSNSLSGGTTETSRNVKDQFGPSGNYTNLGINNDEPEASGGGLGYGYLDFNEGGVFRGGDWRNGPLAGVFSVYLIRDPSYSPVDFGFRCVLHPL